MKLSDLIGPLQPATVVLRGKSVEVRPVTAAQELAVLKQLPAPHSTSEEARQLPAWRQRVETHGLLTLAVLCGIALGLDCGDGCWSEERDGRWTEVYARRVMEAFTLHELGAVRRAFESIGAGPAKEAIGDAETLGNS